MPRFNKGDRVGCPVNFLDPDSRLKYGVVVKVNSRKEKWRGHYPEMYAVRWDDGEIRDGYLANGLRPAQRNMPSCESP